MGVRTWGPHLPPTPRCLTPVLHSCLPSLLPLGGCHPGCQGVQELKGKRRKRMSGPRTHVQGQGEECQRVPHVEPRADERALHTGAPALEGLTVLPQRKMSKPAVAMHSQGLGSVSGFLPPSLMGYKTRKVPRRSDAPWIPFLASHMGTLVMGLKMGQHGAQPTLWPLGGTVGEMSIRHGCFHSMASLLPAPHSFFCQQAGCSEGPASCCRNQGGTLVLRPTASSDAGHDQWASKQKVKTPS